MNSAPTNSGVETAPPAPVSPHPVMVTITVLMVIGVVMVYSALAGLERPPEGTPWYKLTSGRSMMFAPAAFAVMLFMSRFPYRALDSRLIWLMLAACVILLLCVYVPGIGVEKNFRRRWIKVPGLPDEFGLGFQPSEIAKFGLVVFLAWWMGRREAKPGSFFEGFLPAAGVIAVVAGLIAKEDLGTGVITAGVGFFLLVVGGCRWWHPATLIPVALIGLMLVMDGTRWARLLRWDTENRELDVQGKDYQIWNSMLAISNGGVAGQGLGEGVQKLGRLPLKSSDFILAHIIEEIGLAGAGGVLAVYAVLLYQGGLIMTRARDRFGQLIAFGITFVFGMQAFIHAGVVTKLLPNKGINLPFISAGGTGMLIMAAAGGLLAAVARASAAPRSAALPAPEPEAVRETERKSDPVPTVVPEADPPPPARPTPTKHTRLPAESVDIESLASLR